MSFDISDPQVAAGLIQQVGEDINSDIHRDMGRNLVHIVHEMCDEMDEEEVRVSEDCAEEILEDFPYSDYEI